MDKTDKANNRQREKEIIINLAQKIGTNQPLKNEKYNKEEKRQSFLKKNSEHVGEISLEDKQLRKIKKQRREKNIVKKRKKPVKPDNSNKQ